MARTLTGVPSLAGVTAVEGRTLGREVVSGVTSVVFCRFFAGKKEEGRRERTGDCRHGCLRSDKAYPESGSEERKASKKRKLLVLGRLSILAFFLTGQSVRIDQSAGGWDLPRGQKSNATELATFLSCSFEDESTTSTSS